MPKYPVDAPRQKVLAALRSIGFEILRERTHIVLRRLNADGSDTPFVLPNHSRIKASTLQQACRQAGVDRDEFMRAYDAS